MPNIDLASADQAATIHRLDYSLVISADSAYAGNPSLPDEPQDCDLQYPQGHRRHRSEISTRANCRGERICLIALLLDTVVLDHLRIPAIDGTADAHLIVAAVPDNSFGGFGVT